jgi:tetratricopeptide (TPR) repeat protein
MNSTLMRCRWRSLAISFELLGQFEDALEGYREADAPLRGDALLALGRLGPLLAQPHALPPWDTLGKAYRAHALVLAGRTEEAVALARSTVPVEVYEWLHIFECLLRAGQIEAVDLRSLLYRPPHQAEHRWGDLARRRMRADCLRLQPDPPAAELQALYPALLEAYDRCGLPYERALSRLGHVCWLLRCGQTAQAQEVNGTALELARRYHMPIVEADAWTLGAEIAQRRGEAGRAEAARREAIRLREEIGYFGPARP